MKRLLRSVIDVDGQVTQEHLVQNFQRLFASHIDWKSPADEKIYEYILSYFQQRFEVPALRTLRDHFEEIGGTGDVEISERLKDIEASSSYVRTNFAHLLQSLKEDQNKIKALGLLKETQEIITKGLEIKEGRDKIRLQGLRDGVNHFNSRIYDLVQTDYSSRTRGDIRQDGQAMLDEYEIAEVDKDKIWGRFTGLNEIDKICHGIKPGELWVHAAFPGELKCLVGSTTIYDHATNRRRTIEELYVSGDLPIVTALDREGASHHLVRAPASHLVQNGVRDVYELRLASGRRITATSNHKFFAASGWVELGHLTVGSHIAVPKKMVLDGQRLFTDAEVRAVGYLLGDGSVIRGITLTASNDAIRQDFMGCLRSMGLREGPADYDTPSFTETFPEDRAPGVRVSQSAGAGNSDMESPVRQLLELLGLYGKGSYEKNIPEEFFSLPEEQVALLLGALWSTDGSCHHGDHEREDRDTLCRRNDISYASVSETLCLGVQALLLRLGIQSSVTQIDTTYKGEPYTFHTVRVVTRDSKRLFARLIVVIGKEVDFHQLQQRLLPGNDALIPSAFVPDGARVPFGTGKFRYASQVKGRPTMQVDTAHLFSNYTDVDRVLAGDLAWDEVVSVTPQGYQMTYDLSVPLHHSFVADDIVTHNTMFACNWAYNLVTRYRRNVLYFSLEMPYDQLRRNFYVMHSAHARWAAQGYAPLDYRKVRDGELTPAEKEFYRMVVQDFSTNPEYTELEIIAPDRDYTIKDIKLEAEMLHKQTEVGLIVIDHGQLVEPDKRSKDYVVELNAIVRGAKKLALHFNHGEKVPVLMLFQINRQGKEDADKNEGRYKASAIAYANEVEKSADVITTTYLNDDHRRNGTTLFCNLKTRDNAKFEPFVAKVDFVPRRIRNLGLFCGDLGRGMGVADHHAALSSMLEV